MGERDARALGLWLLAAIAVVTVVASPTAHLLVIGAAALVAMTSADNRAFRGLLLIGVVSLVIRTVLFGLVSRGDGMLSTAFIAFTEGLKFTAILACFGAFLCLTSSMGLLRLVPRFMFDAALVLNIAIVFAPSLIRTAGDIRDAQVMRGAKRHHLLRSGLAPLLATALDRSIALAESMESRGYGAHVEDGSHLSRSAVTLGILITSASAAMWIMGRTTVLSAATFVVGSIVTWTRLRAISRTCVRTRYRPRKLNGYDKTVMAGSLLIIGGAIASGLVGAIDDSALVPTFAATALATSLVIPALTTGNLP